MKTSKLHSAMFIFVAVFALNTMLPAQSFNVVETGQVNCYDEDGALITCPAPGDSLYGQDAQYESFVMDFTDNGDGTITDNNTGLMWIQVPSSNTFTWYEAVDYCDELEFAGYDDWRIPSLKELFSISDFNSGWPYLNTSVFTLASGMITKDEQYWSSRHYVGVTVEGGSDAAFGVNHVTGHIKAYPANSMGPIGGKYVRAVRGEAYGVNNYVDNGDGTISDQASGLMWTQDDGGDAIDWKNALTYAENSEFAGYSDWRLPNVKELQSIVDYSYSPSATDPDQIGPAIDPIFNCTQIINEAGEDDYAYYWTSTSAHFDANGDYYYAWYVAFGRAVNDMGEDFHGAGGVRFDTKHEGGPLGEGGERFYNYVRLVRDFSATGVGESLLEDENIMIYPNPASSYVSVSGTENLSGSCTIRIVDLVGKLVYSRTQNAGDIDMIDLSGFQPGVYFLMLTNGSRTQSEKLIVK